MTDPTPADPAPADGDLVRRLAVAAWCASRVSPTEWEDLGDTAQQSWLRLARAVLAEMAPIDLRVVNATLQRDLTTARETIARLESELTAKNIAFMAEEHAAYRLAKQVKVLESDLAAVTRERDELDTRRKHVEAETTRLATERDSLTRELAEAKCELESAKGQSALNQANACRFREELAEAREGLRLMRDAAEMLWVVLANVSEGDWRKQTADWQEVAGRWRDNYFSLLDANRARQKPDSGGTGLKGAVGRGEPDQLTQPAAPGSPSRDLFDTAKRNPMPTGGGERAAVPTEPHCFCQCGSTLFDGMSCQTCGDEYFASGGERACVADENWTQAALAPGSHIGAVSAPEMRADVSEEWPPKRGDLVRIDSFWPQSWASSGRHDGVCPKIGDEIVLDWDVSPEDGDEQAIVARGVPWRNPGGKPAFVGKVEVIRRAQPAPQAEAAPQGGLVGSALGEPSAQAAHPTAPGGIAPQAEAAPLLEPNSRDVAELLKRVDILEREVFKNHVGGGK